MREIVANHIILEYRETEKLSQEYGQNDIPFTRQTVSKKRDKSFGRIFYFLRSKTSLLKA